MPLFRVVSRGSLITAKQGVIPPGGTVEMSAADAASMPAGIVVPLPVVVPVVPAAPVAPVGLKPNPSTGSRRAKDTKP